MIPDPPHTVNRRRHGSGAHFGQKPLPMWLNLLDGPVSWGGTARRLKAF
jgi:hypothetical protein